MFVVDGVSMQAEKEGLVGDIDFFFQAEDGIRDIGVTGVQTCALPIAATWRIHSVPVRTRDGPERLDQVYRRLLGPSPPTLPSLSGEASPPCAPPSMLASRPSARNASRPSTASSSPCGTGSGPKDTSLPRSTSSATRATVVPGSTALASTP